MNLLELLKRTTPSPEPVYTGDWCLLAFRPDLGSQQEFIVGVAAAIKSDTKPYIKWLPTLSKLSSLYGDSISASDSLELLVGAETSLVASFKGSLHRLDTGTPHVRLIPCGYLATDNVEQDLTGLLKRHAGAIWADPIHRENAMDDDWAYSVMRQALSTAQSKIFVPNRKILIGLKSLDVGLDNGNSYGNIVSARYSGMPTIERHINNSIRQITIANRLSGRQSSPALFVVLPSSESSLEGIFTRKTSELLSEVEDMGILQYSNNSPEQLAQQLEHWAVIDSSNLN